jgi:hypothetical protein
MFSTITAHALPVRASTSSTVLASFVCFKDLGLVSEQWNHVYRKPRQFQLEENIHLQTSEYSTILCEN